ncbi:hypothetical protein [Paraburkholderia sp. D1E]|uniref:hypothetical protein n=1 Tax=Paraburkholderia sp. D1E TaxID=3461398 RepID=UPI0040461751
MNAQDKAAAFLLAKLHRTVNTICNFQPDFENVKLLSQVMRDEGGKLVMFSGALKAVNGWLVFPFSLTLSTGIRGNQVSGIRQHALAARTTHDERVLSFLSTIDYLVAVGLLPEGSVGEHVLRITRNGELAVNKESCAGYRAFCTRAAKDLPYDLSLEILGEAQAVAA